MDQGSYNPNHTQLDNLKRVMSVMFGVPKIIISDEDVLLFGGQLQNIVKMTTKFSWTVKVALREDVGKSWDEIEPEPKRAIRSLTEILDSSRRLMREFPKIHSMKLQCGEESIILDRPSNAISYSSNPVTNEVEIHYFTGLNSSSLKKLFDEYIKTNL